MSKQRPAHEEHTRRQRPVDPRSPAERIPPPRPPESAQPTARTPRPGPPPPEPPASGPPEPPPPRDPRGSALYVPWWGFVIVILGVAAITCGMWWFVLASRGSEAVSGIGPSPTPIFVVITATPTLGPPGGDGEGLTTPLAPTETPTEAAAATEPPAAPEDVSIQVGSQVVVEGTAGAGLTVRQGPGVNFTYFFVANDGDRFRVDDGPRTADGYTWWYIVDPADANRAGWAVENYMVVAEP